MGMDKRLIVLPYPDQPTSLKCCLFQGDASAISSVPKLRMFLENLWIRDGEDVTVKMFVAHDTPLYCSTRWNLQPFVMTWTMLSLSAVSRPCY